MSSPTALPPQAALLELSRTLGAIWGVLSRGIGLWAARERGNPLPLRAHTRAARLVARLQALLALLAEGRLPRSCPARPPHPSPLPQGERVQSSPSPLGGLGREADLGRGEGAGPNEPPVAPTQNPNPPRLPRRVGWLMGRVLDINSAASQLRQWLADPATQAVLAEIPQAREPIAALCRMLALPAWPHPPEGPLPPAPPRPRRTSSGPPGPANARLRAAEERKLLWHHRSIEIDDGLVRPGRRPWWMPPKRLIRT